MREKRRGKWKMEERWYHWRNEDFYLGSKIKFQVSFLILNSKIIVSYFRSRYLLTNLEFWTFYFILLFFILLTRCRNKNFTNYWIFFLFTPIIFNRGSNYYFGEGGSESNLFLPNYANGYPKNRKEDTGDEKSPCSSNVNLNHPTTAHSHYKRLIKSQRVHEALCSIRLSQDFHEIASRWLLSTPSRLYVKYKSQLACN